MDDEELKSLYLRGLVSKLEVLEMAKNDFSQDSSKAIDTLRRLAHQLRGSGGTYGFPEVTEMAGTLEDSSSESVVTHADNLIELLKKLTAHSNFQKERLLIIEDDEDLLRVLEEKLKAPNREILIAKSIKDATEIIESNEISMILLDLILPDGDGRNLLVDLKERTVTASIPVIIMTAKKGEAAKSECAALGADEFTEKPFDPSTLSVIVNARLQKFSEYNRELRKDPLTGLANRSALLEAYQRTMLISSRSGKPFSIGLLDIDHFKQVNDTYGHKIGDEVLKGLSNTVENVLRKSDLMARWGGEEFVVLFPDTRVDGAKAALQKALDSIREKLFLSEDKKEFHITFSAGITSVGSEQKVGEAISKSDRLLYKAKASGRNRIISENDEVKEEIRTILLAEDDMLIASLIIDRLERERFEVKHFLNGSDAFEFICNTNLSLAILDVKMPGMDGYELLSRIRNETSNSKMPIIILTSMGKEADIVKGLELGADDYMVKPFSPIELVTRIRKLINK